MCQNGYELFYNGEKLVIPPKENSFEICDESLRYSSIPHIMKYNKLTNEECLHVIKTLIENRIGDMVIDDKSFIGEVGKIEINPYTENDNKYISLEFEMNLISEGKV